MRPHDLEQWAARVWPLELEKLKAGLALGEAQEAERRAVEELQATTAAEAAKKAAAAPKAGKAKKAAKKRSPAKKPAGKTAKAVDPEEAALRARSYQPPEAATT